METYPYVPVPLGGTKLLLSPCVAALSPVSLLYRVAPMGKAGAGPALGLGTLGPCPGPGALGPCPESEVRQGCHCLGAGEAGTNTKECSCCSNKEQ